jgi:hypothetical protein
MGWPKGTAMRVEEGKALGSNEGKVLWNKEDKAFSSEDNTLLAVGGLRQGKDLIEYCEGDIRSETFI